METAQEGEREGDDSYLFSGPISIYTEESREETLTVGKEAGVDFVSAGFVSW